MSAMTGAYTEDTMPQDGLLSENEKKKNLGKDALSSLQMNQEQPPPSVKEKRSIDGMEEEGSLPEIVHATDGCESEAEQQVIDEDRSITTWKRCSHGQNDASLHVEGSLEKEALPDSFTTVKEASFDDKNVSKDCSSDCSDRLMLLEISNDKMKAASLEEEAPILGKVGEGSTAGILLDSSKDLIHEASLDASRVKLSKLHCSIQLGSKEMIEEFSQLESYMDDEATIQLTFHEAVRAGDDKRVASLLANGSVQDLNEPDWNVSGDPPLLVAASNHSLPVLSVLLANGCEPGVRSPRGESALHRAILNGASAEMVLELVQELLKYGCPASVKEAGGGLTALHVLTRQLANAQASKNLGRNFDAALRALELLAKAGPVNAKDHQGRSALHILASSTACADVSQTKEMESMLESFLTAGADPSLKNDRGETPLHESLECGALSTAFLLIPHTPTGLTSRYGESPLHIAARKNYVEVVEKLLEHGEDPSVQDAGGNTPLHLASARGFHQTVSLLVISPLAHLEKLNTDGLTALQVAAESGFVTTVKLLLKAGADPSQTVHYSATALHRHPDISILIDHELTRRRQLAA